MSEINITPNKSARKTSEYVTDGSANKDAYIDADRLGYAIEALNKALAEGTVKVPKFDADQLNMTQTLAKIISGTNVTQANIGAAYIGTMADDVRIKLGEGNKAQELVVPVTHGNMGKVSDALHAAAAKALEIKGKITPDKPVTMADVQTPVFDI